MLSLLGNEADICDSKQHFWIISNSSSRSNIMSHYLLQNIKDHQTIIIDGNDANPSWKKTFILFVTGLVVNKRPVPLRPPPCWLSLKKRQQKIGGKKCLACTGLSSQWALSDADSGSSYLSFQSSPLRRGWVRSLSPLITDNKFLSHADRLRECFGTFKILSK